MITITAGHDKDHPGAVSRTMRLSESDIVTDMRTMVAYYLRNSGVRFKVDGLDGDNLPLKDAIKLIPGSKVAVEFHCNAVGNSTVKGVEALAQPDDKLICQQLCAAVAKHMNAPIRGDKGWKAENSGQHTRLGFVQAGGIILELFFISNDEELKRWFEVKWLIAREVANVLIDHVSVECKP